MVAWAQAALDAAQAEAVRRITRACIACTNDLKQIVSVPAPRKVAKTSGRVYAATKATPGAPPRKLTGRGRASLSYRVDKENVIGYVGSNVIYMPVQEFKLNHKFVEPTMERHLAKYERILSGGV